LYFSENISKHGNPYKEAKKQRKTRYFDIFIEKAGFTTPEKRRL